PLALPDNARVAIWVLPNVEFYEYQPPKNPQRDPWPQKPHPDLFNYSRRDWGNRRGVWRMFDLFDKYDIRGTVSLNAAVFDHFHDDEPTEIKVRSGRLMSIPYSIEINDAGVMGAGHTGESFGRMIRDQFDVLYAEGETAPKVMAICLHPFLTHTPSREKYLD